MLKMIKRFYHYVITYDFEMIYLNSVVQTLLMNGKGNILDVGCGYGRYLKHFQENGFNILGVEQNNQIVNANIEQGLNCISVESFSQSDVKFDLIIMSHIIEHFSPNDLKEFIDFYLDRLIVEGHLIIITPLMSSYFYDDFDHVKPYQPTGIMMVFGKNQAQVQYYSRNKLALKDIWFRKSFYRISFMKSKYKYCGMTTRLYQFGIFISALVTYLSRGYFGKTDGWLGVFAKIDG